MTWQPKVALLGADDPLGEVVLRLLAERGLEVETLHALALEDSEQTVAYGDSEIPVDEVKGFDWHQADILIVATHDTRARRHIESAVNQGCTALAFVSGVDVSDGRFHRLYSGISQAASRILAPVAHKFGLASADLFALLPVSLRGQAGVNELINQTRGVFTLDEVEPEVFPLRIAFNMVPQVGVPDNTGKTDIEELWLSDIRARLQSPELPMMMTASWSPLIYGATMAIHGFTSSAMNRGELLSAFSEASGVTVMDEAVPGGVPTPATDALDSEGLFVGRVRAHADSGEHFALWVVCDVLRLEAAQIVDQLENLIEKKAK